jgi:hypothetical protein
MLHGGSKEKYFKSQLMNLAPLLASDITLLINIFVSTILVAGDPASA